MSGSGPDVIGVGALNVDYIATASDLSARAAEQMSELTSRFEWNVERRVDEGTIIRAMNHLGNRSLQASLGGSAWNAIYSLAHMKTDLRIGYVGVRGRVEAPGLSFLRQLGALGIDHRFVVDRVDQRAGVCLSFIEDDHRVLLTSPCANLGMADLIAGQFDNLAGYLAASRLVHVTSFLDDATPRHLVEVLREALRRNPGLMISFDPGHDWSVNAIPEIPELLGMTSLLFLNYREFKALADYSHGELDDVLGRRLMHRCREAATVYVTKRYDLVEVFSRRSGECQTSRFTLDVFDAQSGIEDATGAGDAFAASVIASRLSQRLLVDLGAHLGLSLARHKMRHILSTGHSQFPDLTRGFLQEPESPEPIAEVRDAVLVVHDGRPEWDALADFLTSRLGVRIVEFVPTSPEALPSSLSRRQLRQSRMAICVLTPSKANPATGRADDRLVHYAGFLHGHFGFSRVAMLVEAGCDTFSNMAGLVRLDFPRGRVSGVFVELERILRREGLATTRHKERRW